MKKFLIFLTGIASFGLGYAMKNAKEKQEPDDRPDRRATSIGGIFFKSKDPDKIIEWYGRHLGFNIDQQGTHFEWRHSGDSTKKGYTLWAPFKENTKYFEPSPKDFMINFRVVDMDNLVEQLKSEGVDVVDNIETYDYGKFVHIMDPEGNKIELWEPDDEVYGKGSLKVTK